VRGPLPRSSATATASLGYDRTGDGEALVLLHPLGADRHVWDPVVPFLGAHREVVTVDLPGFGCSAPLDSEIAPTPHNLSRAVIELLGRLGLDAGRAHLGGNSLGGWVALETAAAGHAASVTAIAPAGLWARPLAPKPQIARRLARLATPSLEQLMRLPVVKRLAFASTVAHPQRIPSAQAAALIRGYARAPGLIAVNRAMRAGTFTRLADIDVPVTLAWPQRDRLIARPRGVPAGVREIVLPGCGHVPMWDDPEAVASVLLFGSNSRAGSGP
jgi:pimeloyl-ACP methyl ester carboxylesterase